MSCECYPYPFPTNALTIDSHINHLRYKPITDCLEKKTVHNAVKEKEEKALKIWFEGVQLPFKRKVIRPSFANVLTAFKRS